MTILLSVILVLLLLDFAAHPVEITLTNTPAKVYFSPNDGCTDAIVKEITNAKSEIVVQAYPFTSAPIAKALVGAH